MKKLILKDSLLIGHAQIDEEHIRLAALANKSMEAISAGAMQVCANALHELIDLLGIHFETEKRIMTELGYPETISHMEQHDDCMGQLLSIQDRCLKGDCLGEACILEVVSIFVDDLITADMGFKGHLQMIGYRA